jgi:photosystem II stability/assembly factor-like uncharacterized protein
VFKSFAYAIGVSTLLVASSFAQQHPSCWLRDGSSPAPSLVFLLCEQGRVMVTADGGKTWTPRETAALGHLRNLDFIDASHGFAVGDSGTLVATSDGGKTWQPRKTGIKQHLMAVQFVGQAGWAVGYDGVVLHSEDGGTTWSPQASNTKETLEGVFFLNANQGWAVGWAGTILRTSDGGKSWQQVKSDAAAWSLSSVLFRDAQNGWIVGFGGQILRSHDGGLTWTALNSTVKSWLTSIAFDGAGRGWITSDEMLLVSDDAGQSWRTVPIEDKLFLEQLIPVGNKLWAVGQLGILAQADGLGWKKIESLVTDDPMLDTDSLTTNSIPHAK